MKSHAKHVVTVTVVLVVLAIGGLVFAWSGLYDIGADDHHLRPTTMLLDQLRERSIEVRSRDLVVPDLEDPRRVLAGAGHYAAMCTGCHLAPGMDDSEIRPGLYPQPPDLSRQRIEPKEAFWVVKHGIKMSAMPAWGLSHDDDAIWDMVAFVRKLPDLTPAQYADIVARAPPDDDMEEGGHAHSHGHGPGAEAMAMMGGPAMPGMKPGGAPAAEAVVQAFQDALLAGNREAALALLAPRATVTEGGETQDRSQYAAHHLGEDIAFLHGAEIHPASRRSAADGDMAMVVSRSEIHASHDGKPLAIASDETMRLQRMQGGWMITSIEWTSQRVGEGDHP